MPLKQRRWTLRKRSARCFAASEISSLRKFVPLLWLLMFNEFKQEQMWNSTSSSLFPAVLTLCMGHHRCPGCSSTMRKALRWLWNFPPQVYAELMRLGNRSPAAQWCPTNSDSTLGNAISVGEHVLYLSPMAFEQEQVMSPTRYPGRGVWNLAGVAWAGFWTLALCKEQKRDKEISEHRDVCSVQAAWEPALAAAPGR